MSDPHSSRTHTPVGETVERHYAEFKAFTAKAEVKTDEALKWWQESHWSALIGAALLIGAVACSGAG